MMSRQSGICSIFICSPLPLCIELHFLEEEKRKEVVISIQYFFIFTTKPTGVGHLVRGVLKNAILMDGVIRHFVGNAAL